MLAHFSVVSSHFSLLLLNITEEIQYMLSDTVPDIPRLPLFKITEAGDVHLINPKIIQQLLMLIINPKEHLVDADVHY